MTNHQSLMDVQTSFGRCLTHVRFFDRFYDIFMASHREIRPMFENTDMVKQKHLLRHGLMSALMFAEDDAMARLCIDRIRDSHGRGRLNIRPDLYPHWINSIVQVVSEFDSEYTPKLGQLWRDALTPAVERIKSGYHS